MVRGDVRESARHLRSGLLLAQESSDWVGASYALASAVVLAVATEQTSSAAKLWGVIESDADALFRVMPGQCDSLDDAIDRARGVLGDERFDLLTRLGRELGWRSVTIEALEVIDAVLDDAEPQQPTGDSDWVSLGMPFRSGRQRRPS